MIPLPQSKSFWIILTASAALYPIVYHFVKKRHSNKTENKENQNKKGEMQEHYLRIPRIAVGAVVGKRGSGLRKLMQKTETDCVIRTIVLDSEIDPNTIVKGTDSWKYNNSVDFEENDVEAPRLEVTFLVAKTDNPQNLELLQLYLEEIISSSRKSLKSVTVLANADNVGYYIGNKGKNIQSLQAKYNVELQISEPLIDDPDKVKIKISGKDMSAIKEVEIFLKEVRVPELLNKVPKYDDDRDFSRHKSLEEELADFHNTSRLLAESDEQFKF